MSPINAVHATNPAAPGLKAPLSQRELEVVHLAARGYSNKEISEKLFISEQTIKNHMHNVFDKLKAAGMRISNRLGLTLWAIHSGLFRGEERGTS